MFFVFITIASGPKRRVPANVFLSFLLSFSAMASGLEAPVPDGFIRVTEGKAAVLFPNTNKLGVFYNKAGPYVNHVAHGQSDGPYFTPHHPQPYPTLPYPTL